MSAVVARSEEEHTFDVVIIGAGFSGLLCANYLMEAGFYNIRLVEMSPSVGGVWSHSGVGSYPGAFPRKSTYPSLKSLIMLKC